MSADKVEADQINGVAAPETQTLVGHEAVRDSLEAAFATGRPPAAIMLHGPRGIGKATFAFSLARALFLKTSDESAERVDAQVSALSHPNLFVLRRARDLTATDKFFQAIRVDDVRAAKDSLHRTRGRAGHRICIVDSIDDCNVNSANALLKILEEPPSDTLFIVLAHRPGGLLPTIRSRCQSFGLRPLVDGDVSAILQRARPEVSHDIRNRAIRLTGGRPRRAFETLMLEEGDALDALLAWLDSPVDQPIRAQLAIAEALAATKGAELAFAQELIRDWIANDAKAAAHEDGPSRFRLASANTLWEKANAALVDAEIYNLDRRHTLVSVFDMIREHKRKSQSAA